ncbi:interleukin-1 receptor accessory protein-like [Perca fluviatilis]|uniref:interleukin-1 receptor accessory protein-like n=1 Tax=Perca fluviatilis TaxID=8168 RepID=UPI0019635E50|nr:interleukin-1 receptor accessory protein-like [Perca fluviatilis]XP_039675584.1 interleukin-1 receptor accessory protein-like [Perca fluviatilis]
MASLIRTLLFLTLVVGGTTAAVGLASQSEPRCLDWGESSERAVSVLEGEAGWLSCPLFSHPSVYNYTSMQSAGHNLVWYRLPEGHELEQPITYSARFSKDRERLWLQPATAADTGLYICMLRNNSSCSKIGMRLKVLRPDEVVRGVHCEPLVAVAPTQEVIPLQEGKMLHCPDLQEAGRMVGENTTVTWYHVQRSNSRCTKAPFWHNEREQKGLSLEFHNMIVPYQGLYFCTVHLQRKGRTLNFTRSINVSAVYPSSLPKIPSILNPSAHQVFTVKQDTEVRLVCTALFPFLESFWEIWWTVDGKTLEKLADNRFTNINRQVKYDFGDRTEESVLVIKDFQPEDVYREFNCSVKNKKGFETRRAQLQEEVSLPSMELGCGLGVTLVLMLLLFVVYHVFWLELLLLYRSWFGTDERHTDDKEYDVYISYARSGEEEQFVLSTLRSVLENELGYSVCIFDRDSLPGGNLSDAIVHSMQRSRRLLFVLSPDFLTEKSFSLLECRLGLYLQHGHRASIVGVVYRSISKLPCVEVAQLRQGASTTVTWRGSRSEPRRSRFWLRLRLALPVRPLAMGRRMIDSTSSHSDLAALALHRAQRIQKQEQKERANQSRRNRQAPPRGRGRVQRERWSQHSTSCSGCAGFTGGQVEDRGVGLTEETQMQQVSQDRMAIGLDPVPKTEPDSTHDPDSTPSSAPAPGPASDPASVPAPDSAPDSAFTTCQPEDYDGSGR